MIALALALAPWTPGDDRLGASEPVACRKVVGFRDYEELDPRELTSDEKLVVYYEPTGYAERRDRETGEYHAHLIQDARIRRKGSDRALKEEKGFLEYEPRSKQPLGTLYLSSSLSLKGLRPGEYEVDLILRDGLDDSKEPHEVTVGFRVIEAPAPPPPDDRTGPARARLTPPSGPARPGPR